MRIIDSLFYGIGELIWDAYTDFLMVTGILTLIVVAVSIAIYRLDKDD